MKNNFLIRIFIIFRASLNEMIKSHILINSTFAGLGLTIICFIASRFAYAAPQKIAIDLGSGLLTLTCITFSLALGVNLITSEIESRTIYMVLSRGVSRFEFLLGKMFSLIIIVFLNFFILSLFTYTTYYLLGGKFNALLLWSFIYILLEAYLLLMLVVLFSLIVNRIYSVLLSIVLWILGHFADQVKDSIFVQSNVYLKNFLIFYSDYFPNFNRLNLKSYVLYDQSFPESYLWYGLLYSLLYMIALLIIMKVLMEKKNFD